MNSIPATEWKLGVCDVPEYHRGTNFKF